MTAGRPAPQQVSVEILGGDPFGAGDRPMVSWWLPDGAVRQDWYRIRTDDGYDSGVVWSGAQTYVAIGGAGRSRRYTLARVQVGTDLGESAWSDPVPIAIGLRNEDDWTAEWIGAPETSEQRAAGDRPAVWLRTEFDRPAEFEGAEARLHITALGIYLAYLNGHRVGDHELAPGYTQYRDRVQVQHFPVVLQNRNVLAVLLADGWYRGRVGLPRARDQFGDSVAVRAQLDVAAGEGWLALAASGLSWSAGPSHIVAADLIAGQSEDRRLRDPAIHRPGGVTGRADWRPVETRSAKARPVAPVAPPVRVIQELRPVSVVSRDVGQHLVDLGQNVNGWVRLSDLGPPGTVLTLRHGEHLDAAGDLTTEHLDVNLPILPEPLPLGQIDRVTSAGVDGDTFEPRFTTHGFRYVQIDGHPGLLSTTDVTGVVVHSDLRRTGWFECNDQRLNRLHEAAVWSLRDNMCSIPTDCPQRERAGWTGDWQVFAPTAAYLYDVLAFSRSWMRDVALDLRTDGCVANMSPCPPSEGFDGPLGGLNGSAGWGDLVTLTPWELYQAYGDASLLRETWPTATRWLEFAATRAAHARHPDRAARHPEPGAHEKYLADSGFHWGEWLEPGAVVTDFRAFAGADKSEVATAYLARSAATAAAVAEVIGESADRYREIAESARRAWLTEFVDDAGHVVVRTQAAHVRALAFDLVPAELRPGIADDLIALIEAAGDHLTTGFLSTGLLLPTLADAGHADVAYRLLQQDTEPSWLTMIDRGATTVWEHWNGVDADGTAHESLNHYSKGAVVSFLHRYAAGLQSTSPGYRTFRVAPIPGGGLTRVHARHDSPYGVIDIAWSAGVDTVDLEVTVPGGTTADVQLPGGGVTTVGPGRHRFLS